MRQPRLCAAVGGWLGRGGPVVDGSSHVFNVPDALVVRSIRKHRCERQQVGVRQQQVARRHGELVWRFSAGCMRQHLAGQIAPRQVVAAFVETGRSRAQVLRLTLLPSFATLYRANGVKRAPSRG